MRAVRRVDQLRRYPYSTSRLPDRAFEDVAYTQLPTDLRHVDRPALVGEAGVAGDDKEPADPAERSDDLLDHASGKVFLLGIAAHVLERQHGNRRLVGQRERWFRRFPHCRFEGIRPLAEHNAVDAYWPGDVLDLLRAHVLEREAEFVTDLVAHDPADADPTGLGQGFEPCRDIDPVAVDVASVPDDVAEIDSHAELDAPIGRHLGVSLGHLALNLDSATHRVDDAGELDEQAVAGGFYNAAPVLLDLRIAQLAADRLQFGERAFLVRPHQPRIARNIGGEDRGEPAGLAHASSPAAKRSPDRNRSRCSGLRQCMASGTITGV